MAALSNDGLSTSTYGMRKVLVDLNFTNRNNSSNIACENIEENLLENVNIATSTTTTTLSDSLIIDSNTSNSNTNSDGIPYVSAIVEEKGIVRVDEDSKPNLPCQINSTSDTAKEENTHCHVTYVLIYF